MAVLVLACFFFSGASGLLFEVLWTRELGLIFGSTTLAISTVLSAFMGGLALGSHLSGRIVLRLRDPLRAYALAEAGVGLYALTVPFSLSAYPALNALFCRMVGDHQLTLSLLRFLATALLLLVPTTLMGATLPLLSHFLVRHRLARTVARAAEHIGALFALNTFGAVVGTFLAGFVLLPWLGVHATNLVAAATNLTLAAVVLLARRRLSRLAREESATPPAPAQLPGEPESAALPTQRQRHLAVFAYAVSGAIAMMYQVLWTRALAIVLGSSVYSFTLILLSFLVGLAGGAALTARFCGRVARPVLFLGISHLLTLFAVLVSYLTIDKLPALFLSILRGGAFTVDGLITTQFLLAALSILPATLAMGAVMPLTMRIYTATPERAGRDVGTAYALNTVGAIAGSFAAGFIVLPGLGLQHGLLGCAAVTALLAALLLSTSESPRAGAVLGACTCVATCALILFLPRWNLQHFSAGLFRVAIANDIIRHDNWPVPKLLYYKDGISTTVSVEQWSKSLALKNNGKVDASNADDMATQIRVGLMPLLFHPTALTHPPKVAVIGYGSGVTIGAVTQFPIGHADVVELEPAVVEAGDRFFGPYNHHPSADPRVRVILGDGRNFLTQSRDPEDRYDAIVSEPSNPWITGVSSLFTVDYWRLARGRLRDDGVFCQWAQLYEMSQRNIKTLLGSFASIFPYTYAFAAEDLSSDVILVASLRPLPLSLVRLARNFSPDHPALRAELQRAGLTSAEDLLADLLLCPDEIPAFSAGSQINTDDNALIEFAAPRDLLGYMKHDPYVRRIYGAEWPYGRFIRYLSDEGSPFVRPGQPGSRADAYARLGRALLAHGKRRAAADFLRDARAVGGGEMAVRAQALLVALSEPDPGFPEVPLTEGGGPSGIGDLAPLRLPADLPLKDRDRIEKQFADLLTALADRRWAHALAAMRTWSGKWVDGMGPDFHLLLGYLLYQAELPDQAVDRLRPLLEDDAFVRRRPALLYYLARAEYEDGQPRAGFAHIERYLTVAPASANPALRACPAHGRGCTARAPAASPANPVAGMPPAPRAAAAER